jgi:hypothetical protein
MSTLLTFADYCDPNWGLIELANNETSIRAFWTAVLQFAAADGATAVHYDLNLGSECLSVEMDCHRHVMVPPPREFREDLFAAICRLAVRNDLRLAFRRLLHLVGNEGLIGRILLEAPAGQIVWLVFAESQRIRIERLPS